MHGIFWFKTYNFTKYQIPGTVTSLVTIIQPKAKYTFYKAAVHLFRIKIYLNVSNIIFKISLF